MINDRHEDSKCIVDGLWGIYVPQKFADNFQFSSEGFGRLGTWSNVSAEDLAVLRAGPEHEHYWETWDSVIEKARFVEVDFSLAMKRIWMLEQDGDLFAVPVEESSDYSQE